MQALGDRGRLYPRLEQWARAGTGKPRVCCILNAGDDDAHVAITLYFEDREPVGPYTLTVAARRTRHLRFNELKDPEPVPSGTPYASVIEADVPVVVQHTRLDSRQGENALMTTIAYADGAGTNAG